MSKIIYLTVLFSLGISLISLTQRNDARAGIIPLIPALLILMVISSAFTNNFKYLAENCATTMKMLIPYFIFTLVCYIGAIAIDAFKISRLLKFFLFLIVISLACFLWWNITCSIAKKLPQKNLSQKTNKINNKEMKRKKNEKRDQ